MSFNEDLRNAKQAETLVREVLQSLTTDYTFEDVADNPEYYYKGDILAIDKNTGARTFIEVKDDSRIADTRNVLCEEKVWFDGGGMKPGNMQSDYDVYCVVSQSERRIYVMDFSVLKRNYKQGRYKEIQHSDSITFCYLCSLREISGWGGGIVVIDY